jgi:hypothetical protein
MMIRAPAGSGVAPTGFGNRCRGLVLDGRDVLLRGCHHALVGDAASGVELTGAGIAV